MYRYDEFDAQIVKERVDQFRSQVERRLSGDILEDEFPQRPKKYYVNNVAVSVAVERVQYYGADGRLITEALKDYSKKNIHQEFSSLDAFLQKWNTTEKKEELMRS